MRATPCAAWADRLESVCDDDRLVGSVGILPIPWLTVAGRELTGITVVDLDVTLVIAGSEGGQNAVTYEGGTGFAPNLATRDNTDDRLVVDPRPGDATSNDAADNIATPDRAVERIPGAYRHRVLVRLDGAGFSHQPLEHIAPGGGKRGRRWEFSVGRSRTDVELDAIARIPAEAWTQGSTRTESWSRTRSSPN